MRRGVQIFIVCPDVLPALFFTFMSINHLRVNRTESESQIMRCYILLFRSGPFKLHNVLRKKLSAATQTMESDFYQLHGFETKHFNTADVLGEAGMCVFE